MVVHGRRAIGATEEGNSAVVTEMQIKKTTNVDAVRAQTTCLDPALHVVAKHAVDMFGIRIVPIIND